jgi:hypothetical protein
VKAAEEHWVKTMRARMPPSTARQQAALARMLELRTRAAQLEEALVRRSRHPDSSRTFVAGGAAEARESLHPIFIAPPVADITFCPQGDDAPPVE